MDDDKDKDLDQDIDNDNVNNDADLDTDGDLNTEPTPEDTARSKGWKPKEEYEGNPEEWVEAKEFLARAPLYEGLHKANRKIKKLEQLNTEMRKLFDKVQETSKVQAMAELRKQFEEATSNQDVKTAIEIHGKMQDLDRKPDADAQQNNEVFNEWVEQNEWYTKDPEAKRYADRIGRSLVMERIAATGNKNLSNTELEEIYEEVAEEVKERFPNKFMNPNRKKPASVNDSSRRTSSKNNDGGKKKHSFNDLPDEAIPVARQLISSGLFTEEKYLENYRIGGGKFKGEE